MASGFRVTTPERTLCDLAPLLSPSRSVWLSQWLIKERCLSPSSLAACVLSLQRRGRPGATARRRIIRQLPPRPVIDTARLYHAGDSLLVRAGITIAPEIHERTGVLSFVWPANRRIVEIDGRNWTALADGDPADRETNRAKRAQRWRLMRLSYDECITRTDEAAAELAQLLGLAGH